MACRPLVGPAEARSAAAHVHLLCEGRVGETDVRDALRLVVPYLGRLAVTYVMKYAVTTGVSRRRRPAIFFVAVRCALRSAAERYDFAAASKAAFL